MAPPSAGALSKFTFLEWSFDGSQVVPCCGLERFPCSGLPDAYASWNDFNQYVQTLIDTGCIDNGKKIWWDIRPHAFFNTIEFRIFDMPATLDDVIAIAALCQALVAQALLVAYTWYSYAHLPS